MVAIRNYDVAELKRLDLAHHLPAQADHKVIAELGGSRIITRADGVHIHDGDGNQILDGMAGLWCVNVGYGRKELAEAAYEQMLELPYYNTFFKTATPPVVKLAAKIAEKMGGELPRITMYIIHPGAERLKEFPYHTGHGDNRLRLGAIGENAVDGGFTTVRPLVK